jgi:hypothetical protein
VGSRHRKAIVTRPDPSERALPAQGAFDELGLISVAEHSLQSLIQKGTDLAARVIPGDPVRSVTIVFQGAARTVASSGELAMDLDLTQYRLGDGPCVTAATSGRTAEVLNTLTDERWPEYSRHAAELGCRSVLSVPLPVQEFVVGGLNGYARTSPNLQAALDSGAVIDQAKGLLTPPTGRSMRWRGCPWSRTPRSTTSPSAWCRRASCPRGDSAAEGGLQVLPGRHPDGVEIPVVRFLPLDLHHLAGPERLGTGAAPDD